MRTRGTTVRERSFYAWGYADARATPEEVANIEKSLANRFGLTSFNVATPPRPEEIELRAPRLTLPPQLRDFTSTDHVDRLFHSYGKTFIGVRTLMDRKCPNPPDAIAYPRNEDELAAVLDYCTNHDTVAIPFGGGTAVTAAVEPPQTAERAITIDLKHMNKVLEVDHTSRAARIQAGTFGPDIETQLKPHGLTLRHYMQSFEFSTLGGWIATRSGGHFATIYTHIDDVVENIRAVSPAGVYQSRRLPASGAGPSPDRMMLGSEGILAVITEAWVRLHKRPTFRGSATVNFKTFYDGADAVRGISQAGLFPANCRLLQTEEASNSPDAVDQGAVLVLSFESADHPLDAWLKRALEICAEFGGTWEDESGDDELAHRSGKAGEWRAKFIRTPYLAEPMIARGIMSTTFESAITWDRFRDFHTNVMDATRRVMKEVTGYEGSLTCRFTHVYPDGPAPYFTLMVPLSPTSMMSQYKEVKAGFLEALVANGGTVTHHHAVGRAHRPAYDKQRPELFAQALRATKGVFDPKGILNPGVLIDP
ncbi:MAG: FAD-binding oxidoreductase [Gammaproteobacteria bacterium]|nr:FAD-binding oxidoreductase [Gammaproteobacteria bacterium]